MPLWDSYIAALPATGERGKLPAKVIAEYSGCTETSPFALMFTAFCGGYNMGAILARGERDA